MSALPLPRQFALTLRGYDRIQVEETIEELEEEIRLLTVDRDAAVREAEALARALEGTRAEVAALQARLDGLCRSPADPVSVGTRVQRVLELARAEAESIVASARSRADAVLREAHERAERRSAEARQRIDRLKAVERRTAARLRATDALLAGAEELLEPGGVSPGAAAA